MNILNALAQKHIIEFGRTDLLPAEGANLTHNDLKERILKSEQSKSYSFKEAKATLGLRRQMAGS